MTQQETAGVPATGWWTEAVIYQIYPRSFADSDGDGIGDLPGITARLGHLAELGVDAVWLSPFYPSPQADAGYDVADYRDVDPLFGTLADADKLIAEATARGLRVIVDLVPNHTSSAHRWFQAALAAAPGQPGAAALHLPGRPRPGRRRAAERLAERLRRPGLDPGRPGRPGQWYLHLFDTGQPDLNWDNPEVRAEFLDVLRFWLDRGVDGFRVDVAHGLIKQADLADWQEPQEILSGNEVDKPRPPMWDQDGVHEIYRDWRAAARRLPRRADPGRRGVGGAGRAAGPLRPPGRDAPGVQLRVPARRLDRAGPVRGDHPLAGGHRRGRRPHHLGALQPRRGPARLPARAAGRQPPPERHRRRRPAAGRRRSACAGPGRPPC